MSIAGPPSSVGSSSIAESEDSVSGSEADSPRCSGPKWILRSASSQSLIGANTVGVEDSGGCCGPTTSGNAGSMLQHSFCDVGHSVKHMKQHHLLCFRSHASVGNSCGPRFVWMATCLIISFVKWCVNGQPFRSHKGHLILFSCDCEWLMALSIALIVSADVVGTGIGGGVVPISAICGGIVLDGITCMIVGVAGFAP